MIGNAEQLQVSWGCRLVRMTLDSRRRSPSYMEKQHGQNKARISASNAEDK